MANPEHVEIWRQGIKIWNQWRKENNNIKPDLNRTDLTLAVFGANLSDANLSHVSLVEADLSTANLANADLSRSNLSGANLRSADLRGVNFDNAVLSFTDLTDANLSGANLTETYFNATHLQNADLSEAICNFASFADIDFTTTKGLDTIHHDGPSSLNVDAIFLSNGKIPEIFLRGCGLPEILIKFLPSMMEEAIVFYSCFISYSHDDKAFAQLLHDRLQGKGIRCWLDEHQLKPGDELHKTIYEGIRVYDKVILCCSETALKSWWVDKEFKNAITKEQDYTETVLIPVTLDDYLFNQSDDNWTIGEIKRRFVQDFSNWKNHDDFEAAFKKVVDALRADGGKPPPPTPKLTRRNPK